jgi:hypothetical protein
MIPYTRVPNRRNDVNRKLPLGKYTVITVAGKIHSWILR